MEALKLNYFTRIYPGELFFSFVTRISDHDLRRPTFMGSVFVGSHNYSHPYLPRIRKGFIEKLVEMGGPNYDTVVQDHTLLPFYSQFLTPEVIQKIRSYMDPDNEDKVIYGGGLPKSRDKKLRFCPLCVECDRQMYGETFWHRDHNIPGVISCLIHKCLLIEWHATASDRIKGKLVSAESAVSVRKVIFKELNNVTADAHLVEIANSKESFSRNQLLFFAEKKAFVKHLNNKYFINASLLDKFKKWLSENGSIRILSGVWRQQLNCIFNNNWTGTQPALYIYLLNFLQTLTDGKQIKFSCVNKYCKSYNDLKGITVHKFNDEYRVRCDSCFTRYAYCETKSEKVRVIYWGPGIQNMIKKRIDDGNSVDTVAEEFSLSQSAVEDICLCRRAYSFVMSTEEIKYLRTRNRKVWKDAIKSFSNRSITEMLKLKPTESWWLLKYDRGWIKSFNRKHWRKTKPKQRREYYDKMDRQLLKKLIFAKADLIQDPNRRITVQGFITIIGKDFRKNRDHYPICYKYIEENVESPWQFKRRQLKPFFDKLQGNRLPVPNRTELYRLFSVRSRTKEFDALCKELHSN